MMQKLSLVLAITATIGAVILTDYRKLREERKIWTGILAIVVGLYFLFIEKLGYGTIIWADCVLMVMLLSRWEWIEKKILKDSRCGYAVFFGVVCLGMAATDMLLSIKEIRLAASSFLCVAAFWWIKFESRKENKCSGYIILVLQAMMTAITLNASNGFVGMRTPLDFVPVILIFCFLYFVGVWRTKIPAFVFTCAMIFLAVVNSFVVQFRGTPILADDIYSVSTALNVMSDYSFKPGLYTAMTVFDAALLIMSFKKVPKRRFTGWKNAAIVAAALVCLLFSVFGPWYGKITTYTWNTLIMVQDSGYFSAFVKNIREGAVTEPDGYSVEAVGEIAENNRQENAAVKEDTTAKEDKKPNLIVIMNESLTDFGLIGDFETEEDYMPFIHSLEGSNVLKNTLIVGGKGGGTSISESEFLLSTSKINYGGVLPWVKCIKDETPSIVSVLKKQGYYTVGMHPAKGSNYNRSTVYPCLGFDKIALLDNTDFDKENPVNGNVSDMSDYEELISIYENRPSDQPFFCFNVTIQNHSPYENEEKIKITSYEAADDVESYLASVKESDKAFRMLTEYFEKEEEDTLILMFGDHQPNLESEFLENILGKNPEELTGEDVMKTVTVPYILWANYDVEMEDIGQTSANYLAPYLLETAGLEMSGFQQFVWKMHDSLPVINAGGCVDADGNVIGVDAAEYQELLNEYSVLTYNYIFDIKNRVDDFFEKSIDK